MEHGPWTRTELRSMGLTDRQLAAHVADGRLVRLRGGIYCGPGLSPAVQAAARAGGRLACISELREHGLWILDDGTLHFHFANSTMRRPARTATRHWRPLGEVASAGRVSAVDAVAQAIECQSRDGAVIALDSALNLGAVSAHQLDQIARVSVRAASVVSMCDGRAESGLETILRLILRDLLLPYELQVSFAGIGRVDVLVADWVIVEADGDRHHSDIAQRRRDRRRDARLTALGYVVLRFGYDQLVGAPATVAASIIGAVEAHRRVKDSRQMTARARAVWSRTVWA